MEDLGPEKKTGKVGKNINMEEIFSKYIKTKMMILSLLKAVQDFQIHAHQGILTPEKLSTFWTNQMKSYFSARVLKVKAQVKVA